MANLDPETKQEISDAEEVLLMTEGRGWKLTEAKLKDKIVDLQSVKNVDNSSPENALADIRARVAAVDILNEWLKNDIYGYIEQQTANSGALRDGEDTGFINR